MDKKELLKKIDLLMADIISIRSEVQKHTESQDKEYQKYLDRVLKEKQDAQAINVLHLFNKLHVEYGVGSKVNITKHRIKIINERIGKSSIYIAKQRITTAFYLYHKREIFHKYLTFDYLFDPTEYRNYIKHS